MQNFNQNITPSIRKAVLADAESLATIHVHSWRSAYEGLIPQTYLNNLSVEHRTQTWQNTLSNDYPDRQTLVLERAEICGFSIFGNSRDEDCAPKSGEIWAIYFAPKYFNMGYGRLLMKTSLEALKSADFERCVVWVLTANNRARRFYEKFEFAVDGRC